MCVCICVCVNEDLIIIQEDRAEAKTISKDVCVCMSSVSTQCETIFLKKLRKAQCGNVFEKIF